MSETPQRKLIAIVLAAGKGTRMNSQLPKVLHSICGRPMLDHVLRAIEPLKPEHIYIVVGHQAEEVEAYVGNRGICVLQEQRLGTGHAVMMAIPKLKEALGSEDADVLVLNGDGPLIRTETLERLLKRRRSHHSSCTVMTTHLDDPAGYGRIVRNRDQTVRKIVEHKDTNIYEEKIGEINTGLYAFNAKDLLHSLAQIKNDNAQKEYYLTDTVEILGREGREVEAFVIADSSEVIGVNSRKDMAVAERFLRQRINERVLESGVTIIDPTTTYIDSTVTIGRDTTIHPFSILSGDTVVGEGSEIGPNATLRNARLGAAVRVAQAVVENATVEDGAEVGPFAVVRPDTTVRAAQRVDCFVELANDPHLRGEESLLREPFTTADQGAK